MNRRIAKKNIKKYIFGANFSDARIRSRAKAKAPDYYRIIKSKIQKEREARAAQLGITQGIFPGDIVQIKNSSSFGYLKGRVTRVDIGLDLCDHGTIEIEVIERDSQNWAWVNPGELEHFVHFNWENDLEIVKE